MSSITDRLRGIVQGTRPSSIPVVSPELADSPATANLSAKALRATADALRTNSSVSTSGAAAVLGGTVVDRPNGAAIVVDREYPAHALHGRQRIGDLIDILREGQDAMATMARAWPKAKGIGLAADGGTSAFAPGASADKKVPPLLFLDLETTGLFGGAGTQAFLVGCAAIDGDSIRVRQFLLPGFEHERMMLGEVAAWAAAHGGLVTYNGRTFDVPLIETRFLFHRLPFPLGELPHLDMLHAARRLWRARPNAAGPDPDDSSCSLAVLEKQLAGLHRIGDVPGYEIPSRYFQFIRDGDARPLESVLEHNRLDLISLAAVMARALTLVAQGPRAATGPHECFGLARLYERAGAHDNAEAAFLRAIDLAQRVGTEPELQADGLRRLAWVRRRSGRIHEAAEAWNRLAALPRCSAAFRREAKEALAIYHEHRSRDLGTARSFVLDVLNDGPMGRRREAAEYRLRRLERKISVRKEGGLVAALDATLEAH
jgi:uncharacterized protein YprB with RNaseH-like and TPR domain